MRIDEIKDAVAHHRKAVYRGAEYTVTGFRGYKTKNRIDVKYAIELLDMSGNSVVYANVEAVEVKDE